MTAVNGNREAIGNVTVEIMPTNPPNSTATRVPAALTRRLSKTVALSTLLAVGMVLAAVKITGRPDWSAGALAATLIALLGAAASLAVLAQAAGRTVDWLVTVVMGATVVRMGVYGIGLPVALYGFHAPAEPTGVLACLFFAVTLFAETALLYRGVIDLSPPAGGTHA